MIIDNALAKSSIFSKMLGSGDTGKRGAERMSFLQWWFTHHFVETGSIAD